MIIIWHVMAQIMKNYLEIVKSMTIIENQLVNFDQQDKCKYNVLHKTLHLLKCAIYLNEEYC